MLENTNKSKKIGENLGKMERIRKNTKKSKRIPDNQTQSPNENARIQEDPKSENI